MSSNSKKRNFLTKLAAPASVVIGRVQQAVSVGSSRMSNEKGRKSVRIDKGDLAKGPPDLNGYNDRMHYLSNWVTPLLTDLYQVTMALAYWRSGVQETPAAFEAFIRKNPFQGEYTLFAGLYDLEHFIKEFRFTKQDIAYIKSVLPEDTPEGFFTYLAGLRGSQITLYSMGEGSVVFPREPLIRIEGPLALCQLMETTLLNLLNFPTLIATNAARMRYAAGPAKILLEFGLRRAQGPDGAVSASRYSIVGGFNATSNLAAGQAFGLDVRGTHAHSFVSAFKSPDQLKNKKLRQCDDFWVKVVEAKKKLRYQSPNEGELVAFVAYALAFPEAFNALVDTYDTLQSGVPNFLAVAVAMHELGLKAKGIRLDSGDLAKLSVEVKKMFRVVEADLGIDLSYLIVVASNDINEAMLHDLNKTDNSIDSFGIGTNLVTCQAQPALGMVFKLMEIQGEPVIKLSNDITKVTIPGRKRVFRLFNSANMALCDVMIMDDEPEPKVNEPFSCRHPYDEQKRFRVTPYQVREILVKVIENKTTLHSTFSTNELRGIALNELATISDDHRRAEHPTEYPVTLSEKLYHMMHELWNSKAPVHELI